MGINFNSTIYHSCYAFRDTISAIFQRELLETVKSSLWFLLLIDENIDISAKEYYCWHQIFNHKKFQAKTILLRLFDIEQLEADIIYTILTVRLKHLRLLQRYVIAWDSNGTKKSLDRVGGVAVKFKKIIFI